MHILLMRQENGSCSQRKANYFIAQVNLSGFVIHFQAEALQCTEKRFSVNF